MADARAVLRRPAVGVTLAAVVLFAVVAGVLFVPWVADDREIVVGTPSPQPLSGFTKVPLQGGQQACLSGVALDPRGQLVNVQVGTPGRERSRIELTVTAPGFRDRSVAEVLDGKPAFLELEPPERSLLGTVCLRNLAEEPVELFGTTEPRTRSRPVVRVDGQVVEPDVVLRLFARGSAGIYSRFPQLVDSAAAYKPWYLSEPVLWVLVVLLVAGVPLATFGAFGWAVARSER